MAAEHGAHEPTAIHHVGDDKTWEFFHGVELPLPNLFGFQITKFMVLELIAAGLILAIYLPIARRARDGTLPRGWFWNAFESLLTFIRKDVVRPTLGEHHAEKFVPFFWTLFLFILFNNLLGRFPFLGSPTASIWVTGGLAVCAFAMLHGPAMFDKGFFGYFRSHWPHIEIVPFPGRPAGHGGHGHGHSHGDEVHASAPAEPVAWHRWLTWGAGALFGLVLSVMIFTIEMAGTIIKSGVLAVRLFANMFAGHMVLATILLFIYQAGKAAGGVTPLWSVITLGSVLGVVALSLLEIFVAFLQAYIFTFLTALFMGMGLHPQH
jgi:F-type H+-transporting ATPase subunit a